MSDLPVNEQWEQAILSLHNEINIRHYSSKTLKTYCNWIRNFRTFSRNKTIKSLDGTDVKKYLEYLALKSKVSASTQNQAFNSLLFFYRHVLKTDFGDQHDTIRAKRKKRLPVVLSRKEVKSIIKNLSYPYDLVAKLLYGCGLRINEGVNLRMQDFDFEEAILTVRDGKGGKDRTLHLPRKYLSEIKKHFDRVAKLHKTDLKNGYDGAFVPESLA